MPTPDPIAKRLAQIREELSNLKKSQKTRIVSVTKTRPLSDLRTLFELGHKDVGENRFGEARDKIIPLSQENITKDIKPIYHHIGPLQSGNARQIPRFFSWVHGVSDQKSLAILLEAALRYRDKTYKEKILFQREWPMHYLFQIHLTNEKSRRGGMELQEFLNLTRYPENDAIQFAGLMTMGPERYDSVQCREVFSHLRKLRDSQAPSGLLSMGMSRDWKIAVEEGANIIRIGSALFGTR